MVTAVTECRAGQDLNYSLRVNQCRDFEGLTAEINTNTGDTQTRA